MPYASELQTRLRDEADDKTRLFLRRSEVRAGALPEELGRRIEVWTESHHLPRLLGGLAGAYVLWRLVLPDPKNRLPASSPTASPSTGETR